MEDSTQEFAKMFTGGKEDLGKILHGYIYGRWPSLYIYYIRKLAPPDPETTLRYPKEAATPEADELARLAVERMLPTLPSTETSTWHGKVVKLDEASALVSVNRDVSLTNLDNVIPYKLAKDIILKNPDHIAVMQCPCRSSKENPCEPLDVCMAIGEPFASFILEHKTNNARKISQEEAIAIIKAEDDRGHMHSAWFKDATAGRFYAICNCCKCCCAAMKAHFFGIPMLASSGYVSQISEECTGCGDCVDFCQFGAIKLNEQAEVIYEKCMGCGVCESKCPVGAISLKRDPAKGEPLDVRVLAAQA